MKVGVCVVLVCHPVTLRLSAENTGWEERKGVCETVGCAAKDVLLVVGLRKAYVYLRRPYPYTVAMYANWHFLAETHDARQRGARGSS